MEARDVAAAAGIEFSSAVMIGVFALALMLFLAAAALAVQAMRSAGQSRLARAEAEAKLTAAQDLVGEVRRLRTMVEEAVLHHNSAVTNAFLLHNDACAATRTSSLKAAASGVHSHEHHDDEDHHGTQQAETATPLNGRAQANASDDGDKTVRNQYKSTGKAHLLQSFSGRGRSEPASEDGHTNGAFLKSFFARRGARPGAKTH